MKDLEVLHRSFRGALATLMFPSGLPGNGSTVVAVFVKAAAFDIYSIRSWRKRPALFLMRLTGKPQER